MAAYGLTEREQEVARPVLQGGSTAGIAERRAASHHTVQQHLKGIFETAGVRGRRELTGKIFAPATSRGRATASAAPSRAARPRLAGRRRARQPGRAARGARTSSSSFRMTGSSMVLGTE